MYLIEVISRRRNKLPEKYLCFKLEGTEFAIPVRYVQEIARAPQKVVPVPGMSEYIRGISKLRNSTLPVIDLKKKLNLCSTEDCKKIIVINNGHNLGVLIDEVVGIILVDEEQIDISLGGYAFLNETQVKGIININDKLICVLSEEVITDSFTKEDFSIISQGNDTETNTSLSN